MLHHIEQVDPRGFFEAVQLWAVAPTPKMRVGSNTGKGEGIYRKNLPLSNEEHAPFLPRDVFSMAVTSFNITSNIGFC